MDSAKIEVYAPTILKLLREVVSTTDQREWTLLLEHQYSVQEYFNRIGLQVVINPTDGFAFLEQPDTDDHGAPIKLPRLTRNMPLTAAQTLLLVLLRERLDEFMNQPNDADDLILSRGEMQFMMEPFLRVRLDQRKIEQAVKGYTNSLSEMGLIKRVSTDHPDDFVIERIIKAKFKSTDIAELKQQIIDHIAHFQGE